MAEEEETFIFPVSVDSTESLSKILNKQRKSGDGTDVTIRLFDPDTGVAQDFQAHRAVLKGMSSYFARLFQSQYKESVAPVISLNDPHPITFARILDTIYGKYPNFTASGVDFSEAVDFALQADYFGIKFQVKQLEDIHEYDEEFPPPPSLADKYPGLALVILTGLLSPTADSTSFTKGIAAVGLALDAIQTIKGTDSQDLSTVIQLFTDILEILANNKQLPDIIWANVPAWLVERIVLHMQGKDINGQIDTRINPFGSLYTAAIVKYASVVYHTLNRLVDPSTLNNLSANKEDYGVANQQGGLAKDLGLTEQEYLDLLRQKFRAVPQDVIEGLTAIQQVIPTAAGLRAMYLPEGEVLIPGDFNLPSSNSYTVYFKDSSIKTPTIYPYSNVEFDIPPHIAATFKTGTIQVVSYSSALARENRFRGSRLSFYIPNDVKVKRVIPMN